MAEARGQPVLRAGLIVNPTAGKASGKGLALAGRLSGERAIMIRTLQQFGQIEVIVREMAAAGVTHLFISSGDGTIQEILTLIAEQGLFAAQPAITLLPHGTTNLSANDVGFRSHGLDAQADFLRNPELREISTRNTIRCANPGDGKPRHGMFVGTGAVAVATRYCQQAFNDQGIKGRWAVAATLLTALRKYFFSPPDPRDESRFDRPFPITVEAEGKRYADGPQLLQMSTTLDKLVLNARPFWGGKTGPIRTSVFPYPVPSAARWMLPVMYGGENRTPPPGCVSFCSNALEVTSRAIFVIDGEFFPPPAKEALRLETGPLFRFVRG
jgi:diacylglycerol kinase family enzyme